MLIKENYNATLETPRLILTPWRREFAPKMYENWAKDKEVSKYLSWYPHKNVEETEQVVLHWISQANYNWCIIDKETNEPVGNIETVKRFDQDYRCEVGYCLSRKLWNKGYMTEALKKVLEFLFDEGYYKIILRHITQNVASGRVMQKAGMTYAGKAPYDCYIKGKFYDCETYYILNPKVYD